MELFNKTRKIFFTYLLSYTFIYKYDTVLHARLYTINNFHIILSKKKNESIPDYLLL